MIVNFDIQPSKILCRYILGLYLLAAIVVTQFHIASIYQYGLLCWLCISAVRFLNKWRKSAILCQYNANKYRWQVSNAAGEQLQVIKVRPVYVTSRWVWINFYPESGKLITVLAATDSMQTANFLQLRRSVICPAALRSCSA